MKPRPGILRAVVAFCAVLLAGWCVRAAEFDQRLANLSSRAQVGTGANVAVVGFVIGPGAPKSVLIRAVGPGLASYGVAGTLGDPRIDLYDSSTPARLINSNDNWTTTTVGNAATFSAAGAFTLATGSRDAALLQTNLAPGLYTAQITGVANTSGIALVEVYDVTGAARLLNLSTRAQVGTGAGIIITGLVVAPGAGNRRVLVRAVGPTLGRYGVAGPLTDPAIAVLDGTTQITANDNWESVNAEALRSAFVQAGAFPLDAGARDAALLVDLPPARNYTIQVSGVGNTTGVALVEVYDLTQEISPTVRVAATTVSTDSQGGAPAVFTISRSGPTASSLTVYYQITGSAIAGADFEALPGRVSIPAGATSAQVPIKALPSASSLAINKDVSLQLAPGFDYTLDQTGTSAAVAIFYNPGTLYVSSLRAPTAASTSTAYGTATVQLSADEKFAQVSVTFSNLTSPQTVAYLRVGNPGEVGAELMRLPNGQVNGVTWPITASGALSAADVVKALKEGRIFLSIESARYPAGELRGTLLQSSGSLSFSAPPAPPALADAPLTAPDVARFLTQATFGPTPAEVDALTGKRAADLDAWISAQIALAPSLHLDATDDDWRTYTATGDNPQYAQTNRQAAWWKLAVQAPDQLRQRVAFALSQIFVVSDQNGMLTSNARALANYYDIMVRGAFGNFRQVLEDVTLSPIMGVYLTHLRNARATYNTSGALLTSPDENYARELMQLFTIGLNELQPDGTLRLDALGRPIPTYDNRTITETAKVLTGWAFFSANPVPNFRGEPSNFLQPMMLYPAFHEPAPKAIVGGITIPANLGGETDLKILLDALWQHANTGPFISRQLIQRLVTSNPSPGYVYRVARVFADNGRGVRGDLGAVVRAILLDSEARDSAIAAGAAFGKLKEPLLRVSAVLRAFGGGANNGRYLFTNPESTLGQAALRANTVFNFYEPDYVYPGALAGAGLVAPEYQILNDTTAISIPNQLWNFVYATRSGMPGTTTVRNPAEATLGVLISEQMLALARTPPALVDRANLLLAAGRVPVAVSNGFVGALSRMPAGTGSTYGAADLERVRSAIYLMVSTPQGAVQK